MCKVSVIIPVYRVERYLPECLDSVLSQSLSDIEVIAIDDASPDRCGEILDEYAARDPRVQVIHLEENHRQGYGRNRGLERATGEYVYFLDSDDTVAPDALSQMYEAARRDALDCLFFDSRVQFENGRLKLERAAYVPERTGTYKEGVCTGPELFDAFVRQREFFVYVQRVLLRTAFLRAHGIAFPEEIEHEDELFMVDAAMWARRARYCPDKWFIYRVREDSVMTREKLPRDFFGYFRVYCQLVDRLSRPGWDTPAMRENAAHLFELMQKYHPLFLAEGRQKEWFAGRSEWQRYQFYCALSDSDRRVADWNAAIFAPLGDRERIWLYGAGRMAEACFARLCRMGRMVVGFVVSDKAGNPDTLHGRPVCLPQEADIRPGDAVIVAMARTLHGEVSSRLKAMGIEHFLYASGRLTGPVK